jgi:hypothetical protein
MFLYFYNHFNYLIIMRLKSLIFLFLFALFGSIGLYGQTYSHINYQENYENFPNPGRGFYHAISNIDYNELLSYRKQGISLIFKTYHLGQFKHGLISTSFLRNMEEDFQVLRKAGMKAIIRFSYTDKSTPPYGDARPEIVLKHVAQLKPVLRANSDVILVLQAGFIGAWGEWYYTDYYSVSPGNISAKNWADRRQLVDSLLSAMPANRMIQVRTPNYKIKLLNLNSYTPVSQTQAYTNLPIARIAHHNDCFVSSPSDVGTYIDSTIEKPYLAKDSKYTIVGGETCQKCAQSTCSNAVREMRRFHWTFLNKDYNQSIIREWQDQGCFPEIQRKLGYRFRLLTSEIQDSSKPGGIFHLNVKMINDGWANPTNPRPVEVILKNKTTGKTYYVNPDGDMRFWPINDTININITAGLPKNFETGNYDCFLNFPDADDRLNGKPEYSIRLANTHVWDSVLGYNSLNHEVKVDTYIKIPVYYGGKYFKETNSAFGYTHIIIDGKSGDWENIPITYSATAQRPHILKIYNTADTLFLLITGDSLFLHNRFLLNTDNNALTGAFYGPWLQTGFDYMIDSNRFFQYSGTNHEFSWSFLNSVNIKRNNHVVELKIPFNQIDKSVNTIKLGYVNTDKHTLEKYYLPLAKENLIAYKKNNTAESPKAIMCKNYGTHNIVYWTRNLQSDDVYTVLQKAVSGGKFEDLAILRNDKIDYLDDKLQPGNKVSYRVQYKQGNNSSAFSDTISKVVSSNQNQYVKIHLDGNPDDWNLIPPSATGIVNNAMSIINFFNLSDADSLFFSINAKMEHSYRVNFDINDDNNIDWYISNDSLFSNLNGKTKFVKILSVYRNADFLESGIKMSEVGMDTVDTFSASLFINGHDIWGHGEHFTFMKYQSVPPPKYFKLGTLTDYTYSRIKISWYPDQSPDGYVIERSDGDSLHFKQLVSLDNTKFQYIDKNLDSSVTYYYRIFSFKGIVRSAYTTVKWMQPGRPLGIYSITNHNASVAIIPNPIKQQGKIEISLDNPDNIQISIYTLNGQKIKSLHPGIIIDRTSIPLNVSNLKAGYYLLKIAGEKTLLFKRLIIN